METTIVVQLTVKVDVQGNNVDELITAALDAADEAVDRYFA